jgi:hypothetical protein
MAKFYTSKPIVIGISEKNLDNCILDFTAGLTDKNLYEFQKMIDKENVERVMFLVHHPIDEHPAQGKIVEVIMDCHYMDTKFKDKLVWRGMLWFYDSGSDVLIIERLKKQEGKK